MRTQYAARKLTAELTCVCVWYKHALRAVLPPGVSWPAEVTALGLSAVACIRSALAAQADLARAILDVKRLAAKPRSARTACERLCEDIRHQTTTIVITCGEVQVELGVIETLYGIFPYGQVMATVAACPSRSTLESVRHQSLMSQFDPSAAVAAINKAIQMGKKSESSLDWDKITRAIYGLFSSVPMVTR